MLLTKYQTVYFDARAKYHLYLTSRTPSTPSSPSPIPRPKIPHIGQPQPTHAFPIRRILIHRVPPPIRKHAARIRDTKENHDPRQRGARIQRRRQNVIVLGPPREELAKDPEIEDDVNERPARVVDPRGRGHVVRTHEDERPVDLAPEVVARLLPDGPGEDGHQRADPEEMQQGGIDLAGGVEARGADEAPDHARRPHRAAVRAREAAALVRRADVADIVEHPRRDADGGEGAEDGGAALRGEEEARRDLQVEPELHVLREENPLRDDVLGQDLEDHVRERFPRKHVAADELGRDVQLVGVDVGDSLDDAAGDHVHGRDEEGEEDAVDGEVGVVDFDEDDGEDEHDEGEDAVPPPGGLLVCEHEAPVDVELLPSSKGVTKIVPVPEVDMD